MAASAFMPDVTVEIAFDSGYATPAGSRTWTDVSAYVEAQTRVSITRGRQDEFADVSPSTLTLTLDNRDGRFTPNSTSSPYGTVTIGQPIRVSAVWPLGGGGTTYRRFTGYVDEWAVQWPTNTSGHCTVNVHGSSRTARLGRSAGLASVVEQETLADGPAVYFPLGEPEGSGRAHNVSTTPQSSMTIGQYGSGGTLEFAAAEGPPTDGMQAPQFTPSTLTDGKYLTTRLDSAVASAHVLFECFVQVSTVAVGIAAVGGVDTSLALQVDGSGRFQVTAYGGSGNISTTSSIIDGQPHHLAVKLDDAGANHNAQLFVDGVQVQTASNVFTNAQVAAIVAADARLVVGRQLDASAGPVFAAVSVSHVALYGTAAEITDARVQQHAEAGLTGFEGETSDEWIERLAGYGSVPSGEMSLEAGSTTSVKFADFTGRAPIEVMQDIARTENGLLFDAGDGTLTFHSRAHRYNQTPAAILSAATQQIEGDLTPKLDDYGLLNDVTATNGDDTTRVVDQTSVADRGVYAVTLTVLTTDENEVADAANWRAALYADPQVRIGNTGVQVVVQDTTTVGNVLGVELGELVTLTGLPSQADPTQQDFFVEGYTETFGYESFSWQANLSPAFDLLDVWTVQDAVFGQYDAYPLAY